MTVKSCKNCINEQFLFQSNQQAWPYPCSRPLFKTCWLYRTVNFKTIAAASLQLRILWACLRWDDMQVTFLGFAIHVLIKHIKSVSFKTA